MTMLVFFVIIWVMIVIVTLVGWPHYKRMLQPPPWFSPRHGFGSSHVCCAWHRAQGEASTSLNHHINFYQYSTFYLFFNICQKRCLVTGLSGCAWRRGEARPGARRPARTHTTGQVFYFLAFFCFFKKNSCFCFFRLFCLFSSGIVSFPGSALRRRRRRKGQLLSKEIFFFVVAFF